MLLESHHSTRLAFTCSSSFWSAIGAAGADAALSVGEGEVVSVRPRLTEGGAIVSSFFAERGTRVTST